MGERGAVEALASDIGAALGELADEWDASADFLVERHQEFAEARGLRTAATMLRAVVASNDAFRPEAER